jgi:hypothetical protein
MLPSLRVGQRAVVAQGNYWADEFKNPEHRIDKIGLLVRTVAAG